ncbi:hypothetical protein ACFQ0K_14725 [Nocardioides caeni]|uniref:DUF559 domain-containing protein n=1 Tax=Nocardioides caeni TaxID=574700 RepID=A0A4S8NHY0_9ACTN|nr:hypothetical protein [Nocardioides caeni]THV14624.1 hypothetical protein E9934_08140 [Nocardioides caeni]
MSGVVHRPGTTRCAQYGGSTILERMEISDLLDGRLFTIAGAVDGGVRRSAARSLVDTGQVRPVLRDVYVAAAVPDDLGLRARAASLVMPPHAVVCDRSAAWLWGIDLLDFAELDLPPRLDVVSFGGKDGSHRQDVFGGKRCLAPDEITQVRGICVTTPIRTACDIACLRERYRALAALDAFRREFAISQAELAAYVARFRGRRGVIQLRQMVALSKDGVDSQPESWVRLMIHDVGLPIPADQVWVQVPGWGWVRMENAYEHLRIAVEYDGEEFHTSEDDRERDRLRREALAAIGWVVIVVRKADLSASARTTWLSQLDQEIDLRKPAAHSKRIFARGPDLYVPRGPRRRR